MARSAAVLLRLPTVHPVQLHRSLWTPEVRPTSRSFAALSELTEAAVTGGIDAVFAGTASRFAPLPGVEERRDALRKLGQAVERDECDREEALADASSTLHHEHPLVRLASLHTVARIAPRGDRSSWEALARLAADADELVRVGSVRGIARIALRGDADAIAFLVKVQQETADENLRKAAKDAEARVRGTFGTPPGAQLGSSAHAILTGAAE
mmetsp:Transcript_19500/g.35367  ORF Transcript_19500/g.35367 Transcript_19500/m.35367 type:complete len:212 (+) Transcript_19500:68-703(+)